jgi:hypothetical protein
LRGRGTRIARGSALLEKLLDFALDLTLPRKLLSRYVWGQVLSRIGHAVTIDTEGNISQCG